ncbi:MAG: hypothetical protein LBI05_08070, partial [Planctomycetaceae bacterium]|nr:hypothetical protein [Planctomycetaceae bacterium]
SVGIRPDDFLNLPPLTEAQAFDTKHPHSGFASHRLESIKGQGRSLRMPEHIATGSSANYNYASVQKDSQSWDCTPPIRDGVQSQPKTRCPCRGRRTTVY